MKSLQFVSVYSTSAPRPTASSFSVLTGHFPFTLSFPSVFHCPSFVFRVAKLEWRIRFKLATLTYNALHTGRPPYLTDLVQFHTTPKSTRSSSTQLLFVPHHNLSFGSRAFRVSAPKVWNTLPLHIRQSQSLSTFRRHLKTHYFQLHVAYPAT